MAKLSDNVLAIIFSVQRQLIEGIDETAATESMVFEQFGEIEITLSVLEQLQNVRERLLSRSTFVTTSPREFARLLMAILAPPVI